GAPRRQGVSVSLLIQRRQADGRHPDQGSVAMIVALSLLAMMGMAALALDWGRAFHARTQLQAAVDAAALAGVKSLNGKADGVAAARVIMPLYAAQNSWSYTGSTGGASVSNANFKFGNWNPGTSTFTEVSDPTTNAG